MVFESPETIGFIDMLLAPYGLQNEQTHIPHGVGFFMPKRTANPRKHWGQHVERWRKEESVYYCKY